jgi:hypothetical protein
VATLAKHIYIIRTFIPQASIIPVMNLQAKGGVANLAAGTGAEHVGSKGRPVVGGQVNVLVPLPPGHEVSLAGETDRFTPGGFSFPNSSLIAPAVRVDKL